jgi:hypothetical protein
MSDKATTAATKVVGETGVGLKAFLIGGSLIAVTLFIVWAMYYITGDLSGDSSSSKPAKSANGSGNGSGSTTHKIDYSKAALPTQSDLYEETPSEELQSQFKGVNEFDKAEVFNVRENVYRYPEAEAVCQRYGANLATKGQIKDAYENGANWCNLGWCTEQDAYYPTQKEQVTVASQWPNQFKGGCGEVGINGGFYPAQLKLSVNCYGKKPTDTENVNPWNTLSGKWSRYS